MTNADSVGGSGEEICSEEDKALLVSTEVTVLTLAPFDSDDDEEELILLEFCP